MKDIYIIGNGVIAKALAVALTLNGKKVTILRGSVDEQRPSIEHIEVETENGLLQANVRVSTLSNHEHLDGFILLTNKSFGNEALAQKLKSKTNDSPIVFLQNGLNIENCFIERGFPYLYRCVLFSTSQSVSKNRVKFKAVAESPIGVISGSPDVLEDIVNEINTAVFAFRAEKDIQTVIWRKVISNCVFNSICPLLEIDNGVFHRDPAALQLAEKVVTECVAVANENGINLNTDEMFQNLLLLSRMSEGQKISTYQDILNNRETEIDTLNFAVARAAKEATVPVTLLLGSLVKIKSGLHIGNLNHALGQETV